MSFDWGDPKIRRYPLLSVLTISILHLLSSCNNPPVADAGDDFIASPFEKVTFDGSGSFDEDGEIVEYLWEFGDGETGRGLSLEHTYNEKGRYEFKLRVKDEKGAEGEDAGVAYITIPPVAEAGPDKTGMAGYELTFDGSASSDPDGEIVSFLWDFGDGFNEEGSMVSHVYNTEGEYVVTLTVRDEIGAEGSDSASVQIYPEGYAWWTFLIYMNADNDLEFAGLIDFNEMEKAGSSDLVNIVVQFDRISGYDSSNENWTECRRYEVNKDSDSSTINSTLIESMGECDMGSPSTLSSFFIWGMENYPAVRYGLIIWDHGEGWYLRQAEARDPLKGFSMDETDFSQMSVVEGDLERALSEIKTAYGRRIELLGFDACIMQMWEVGYITKDYANFMVASEASESYAGWDYDSMFSEILERQEIDGAEVGDIIGRTFHETGDSTMSTVDLSVIPSLSSCLSEFASSLISENSNEDILEIMNETIQVDFWFGYGDLYDFASRISSSNLTVASRGLADKLVQLIEEAVTSNYVNWYEGVGGISIYLPTHHYDTRYSSRVGAKWAQETMWDDFLASLF